MIPILDREWSIMAIWAGALMLAIWSFAKEDDNELAYVVARCVVWAFRLAIPSLIAWGVYSLVAGGVK